MIGIYRIYNSKTGKSYVGSSINITRRLLTQFYLLRKNKSHSPKLQAAFNKHGEQCFLHEVIETCDVTVLADREQYWIRKFDGVKNGYNCSDDTKMRYQRI